MREHHRCAQRLGEAAGVGALRTMPPTLRWSIIVPIAPALARIMAIARGREKSWQGEVATALAFSGAAVPVAWSAGAPLEAAAAVAIPFALLFVVSTLAVRVVILRVRGGGGRQATTATRRAALFVAGGAAAALTVLAATGLLAASVFVAAAPVNATRHHRTTSFGHVSGRDL